VIFLNLLRNKTDYLYPCTYLSASLFHLQTARPISTNFCTDLCNSLGKVLNTSLTLPTQPSDPGVPQIPKPKQITREKNFLYKKCIEFFPVG